MAQIETLLATANSGRSVNGGGEKEPGWFHTLRQTSFELGIGIEPNTGTGTGTGTALKPSSASAQQTPSNRGPAESAMNGGGGGSVAATATKEKHVMISYCWPVEKKPLSNQESARGH